MADLNSCSLTGRLVKDAVVTSVGAKGTQLTKFSIANNTGFGDFAHTNFFNVQVWGKAGVAVAQYLTKGKQIALTGVLECQKWNGQDGTQRETWQLTASSVTLLSGTKREDSDSPIPETIEAETPTF